MKKLSLILASALLFGSISFASPVVKKQAPAAPTAAKQTAKPAAKAKSTKTTKKAPAKKAAAAKPATK